MSERVGPGDREAETGARHAVTRDARPGEALEQRRLDLQRHARTGVLDRQPKTPLDNRRRNNHGRAAVAQCVRDQVGDNVIEDGRIGRPVRDVRFTDSVLRILDATEELTAALALVGEADLYGERFATAALCPALRAGGFRVTGSA